MFGERVRAGERFDDAWGVRVWTEYDESPLDLVPLTESVDFDPETGVGKGGKGGTAWDMGAPDAARLRPDCLRPPLFCFFELELVAERTDLVSPSLTAPRSSCDWAFRDANDVGDSTTVFGTRTRGSS